jgi:hypothetical protein
MQKAGLSFSRQHRSHSLCCAAFRKSIGARLMRSRWRGGRSGIAAGREHRGTHVAT